MSSGKINSQLNRIEREIQKVKAKKAKAHEKEVAKKKLEAKRKELKKLRGR